MTDSDQQCRTIMLGDKARLVVRKRAYAPKIAPNYPEIELEPETGRFSACVYACIYYYVYTYRNLYGFLTMFVFITRR
jgi:hypothetical protein